MPVFHRREKRGGGNQVAAEKGFDISQLKEAASASREASKTRVAGLMAPFLSGEQIIA